MDEGLFDAPEKMIKIHGTLKQYWRQILNINKKLSNTNSGGKSELRKRKQEVQDKIYDLSVKLY
ncbi:MAG: hypothetical protein NT078_01365 [Candidatus Azambacteria bacterium]|nr:hypothetical protein [Candidatus Azambacteria bacterium]